MQAVVDDATDDKEIIEKIVNAALDWVGKDKIPRGCDRLENIPIKNFTIEPEHFFVETFPRIFVEVFTSGGCGCRCVVRTRVLIGIGDIVVNGADKYRDLLPIPGSLTGGFTCVSQTDSSCERQSASANRDR